MRSTKGCTFFMLACALIAATVLGRAWAEFGCSSHAGGTKGELEDTARVAGIEESASPFDEILGNLPQVFSELGARSLAEAIRYSRDQAVQHSRPIPQKMRQALEPYFSRIILDKARYTWDWNVSSNLTLDQLVMANDSALALTLDNVIVFRKEPYSNDLSLWAHELKHVEQYDKWGIEVFSKKYLLDHDSLEEEAYDYASYVLRNHTEKTRLAAPPSSNPLANPNQRAIKTVR